MKKSQWITIVSSLLLVAVIFIFGKTVPPKKLVVSATTQQAAGNKASVQPGISTDTILAMAKKGLNPEQVVRLNTLENSISRGNVKEQQLNVYHQLAHFWSDSAHIFEPYAWYEAEAARLENSEKSLTFAARLFLDNLIVDEVNERRRWKAMQAKDLFERSLMINPANDSAKVSLGACYLFGGISSNPMEGIAMIREVAERDSSNIYAQVTLAKGAVISGQYDKAIPRLERVNRLKPDDIDAVLLLAEMYERTGDKSNAVTWYRKSLQLIKQPEVRAEIEKRIKDLSK